MIIDEFYYMDGGIKKTINIFHIKNPVRTIINFMLTKKELRDEINDPVLHKINRELYKKYFIMKKSQEDLTVTQFIKNHIGWHFVPNKNYETLKHLKYYILVNKIFYSLDTDQNNIKLTHISNLLLKQYDESFIDKKIIKGMYKRYLSMKDEEIPGYLAHKKYVESIIFH